MAYPPSKGDRSAQSVMQSQGIAVGRDAQATVSQMIDLVALGEAFESIHRTIDEHPEISEPVRAELNEWVTTIRDEVLRGEQANPVWVERLLKNLALAASDIFALVARALAGGIPGLSVAVRRVAEAALAAESDLTSPTFEAVAAHVNASQALDDPTKDALLALLDTLGVEVVKDDADIREVRRLLRQIVDHMPTLRQPLWYWLSDSPAVGRSVKMIAGPLLTT
jgi:hypothetical protein